MITFACPECRISLRAPEDKIGVQVKCPKCSCLIHVPDPVSDAPVEDVVSVLPADEVTVQRRPSEKYCVECGARIRARAVVCPECGVSQTDSSPRAKKHCHECGAVIRGNAAVCPKCGVEQGRWGADPYSEGNPEEIKAIGGKKMAAALCGLLLGLFGLGGFGVHKFILGLTTPAIIMLSVTIGGIVLAPCLIVTALAPVATTIIAIVEGIIYLTKSDEDFYRTYIVGKRGWF